MVDSVFPAERTNNTILEEVSTKLTSVAIGALAAGSEVIGKVGVDQTTPGTTDSVTVATAQGAGAAIGAISGAAVITDANGTIQQYLRGLVKRWVDALGAGTAAAALRTTLASDDPAVATLGATTGAKVITDANGTIQQYLRGLVSLISGTLSVAFGASATGGYSFLNIAAGQATTVVKANAGTLHSIVLNSAAAVTNTTVIYDHASGVGTVIGRPAVVTATIPVTLLYDVAFANGLTIITAIANGGDMTVCFK